MTVSFPSQRILAGGLVTACAVAAFAVTPATATTAPASAAAQVTRTAAEEKISWKIKRLTFRENTQQCWEDAERARLTPEGGGRYVFVLIRHNSSEPWRKWIRQTTLANGQFDFAAPGKEQAKYKTKYLAKDFKFGKSVQTQFFVPGDAEHYSYRGWTCTTSAA